MLTLISVYSLVGTDDSESILARTKGELASQRASLHHIEQDQAPAVREGDAVTRASRFEDDAPPTDEFVDDEDLIDDASGFDPTPDVDPNPEPDPDPVGSEAEGRTMETVQTANGPVRIIHRAKH